MSTIASQQIRFSFINFLYAIIVGSSFNLIPPLEKSFRFFGYLFLLVMILEDFYLYQSQISGKSKQQISLVLSLLFEIFVLLSWYFMTISFPSNKSSFLISFICFFSFKFLAGIVHFGNQKNIGKWELRRTATFLCPILSAIYIIICAKNHNLNNLSIWPFLVTGWLFYVILFWFTTYVKTKKYVSSDE